MQPLTICLYFFFNDTATTEIYTLSLHDALPIYQAQPKLWSKLSSARRHKRQQSLDSRRLAGPRPRHLGKKHLVAGGQFLGPLTHPESQPDYSLDHFEDEKFGYR